MPEALTNATRQVWIHHMAITLFVLICANNLCSSIMTALAGNSWADADGQTRFLIVTSIAGNLTGTLIAFFRQQITTLAKGGDPFVNDSRPPLPTDPYEKI